VSAAGLEEALALVGIPCRVEARDRLAVITLGSPNANPALLSREARARALALARAHGFTHMALELPEPESGASLPRP
jgi:hypothetical protein